MILLTLKQKLLWGNVSIITGFKKNFVSDFFYNLDGKLDSSLLGVCFYDENGIRYDLEKFNLKSEVKIGENLIKVPFNKSGCYKFEPGETQISYKWVTKYIYSALNRNNTKNNESFIQETNKVKVLANYDGLFPKFIFVVLGWWASCLIVMEVYKRMIKLWK